MSNRRTLDPAAAADRRSLLAGAVVWPDSERCVQCGTCSYACPLGIDVRGHARRGVPILDRHCLACGECVRRCPRDALRFEPLAGVAR